MSLQFQDVTRQEIEGAMSPLKQIGAIADDMVVKIDSAGVTLRTNTDDGVPMAAAAAPRPAPQSVAAVKADTAAKMATTATAKPASVTRLPTAPAQAAAPTAAAPTPGAPDAKAEEEGGDASAGDVLFF